MKQNNDYIFETVMEVRDYECDIEGIVNNANYLHYTEHTRHLFLKKCGLSFAEMHLKGEDAVVARMNLQYKTPLRCDDVFVSKMGLRKEGIKYVFRQKIYKMPERKVCNSARFDCVVVEHGQLCRSRMFDDFVKQVNKKTL